MIISTLLKKDARIKIFTARIINIYIYIYRNGHVSTKSIAAIRLKPSLTEI